MQNIAEFRIIGRVGKITQLDKVSFIEVAANYPRKVNDQWADDTHWNRVTLFGKLHDRAEKIGQGDLVHITGRVRQNRFEKNGETQYTVDLVAERIGTLFRKNRDTNQAGTNHGYDANDFDDDIPY
ncbi:single-stranded DNA-binding protein [Novosphingobium acidiphilum]|jgi:single-strand DNA-binding protein|uniref:single-stranded DNA-binding protein n=1 Tax=Novosphingobium acidiphilum TaxID=505248 RepID=UPI00041677E8|nr:single-stranded DNA-binding protein [Novosphingobium acidiphilum]